MKKFYITREVLGMMATGVLFVSAWHFTHSFKALGVLLLCLMFIEFGCFAWRDRMHKYGNEP